MAQNNPVYLEFACESNKGEKNSTRSVMYLPKQTYEACALHTEFDFFSSFTKLWKVKLSFQNALLSQNEKRSEPELHCFSPRTTSVISPAFIKKPFIEAYEHTPTWIAAPSRSSREAL